MLHAEIALRGSSGFSRRKGMTEGDNVKAQRRPGTVRWPGQMRPALSCAYRAEASAVTP